MIITNFRNLYPEDWPAVRRIYLEGIATGMATFQTSAPSWEEWDKSHLKKLRFVAIVDNEVAGWIALSAVSARRVYEGVAEVSVYVSEIHRGNRIGYQLLNYLITESEKENIWTLQAGIFPHNIGSIRLHENAGFRIVGFRERIGQLNGTWLDTLILERRSKIVGV